MGQTIDEHERGSPSVALEGVVAFYSGYHQRGVAPALHRGLASPYLTLIFTIHEPLRVTRHVDPGRAPSTYDALLGGLHVTPAHIRHDGAQSGIQVHLFPLGARRLLNMPAGEIAKVDLPAEVLLGSAVGEVGDKLRAARSWPNRFREVDSVLARLLQEAPPVAAEVAWAWARLVDTGGRVAVHTLAGEVGWSERYLSTRLRKETGLTPKVAGRVIRFDRARRMLQRTGGINLAGVAHSCGYFDQAHMSREFLQMAELPPKQWLDTEFGKVQYTV